MIEVKNTKIDKVKLTTDSEDFMTYSELMLLLMRLAEGQKKFPFTIDNVRNATELYGTLEEAKGKEIFELEDKLFRFYKQCTSEVEYPSTHEGFVVFDDYLKTLK